MHNKVFDEQALLFEIERVFGKWGSHAEVMKGMIETMERLEKDRSILINCVLDLHTLYNDQRVKQALDEIGYVEADNVARGTITLTSRGDANHEQYYGTTDNGDVVYILRWGTLLLFVNDYLEYEKEYDDKDYFEDGELESFMKEAGYNIIKQF